MYPHVSAMVRLPGAGLRSTLKGHKHEIFDSRDPQQCSFVFLEFIEIVRSEQYYYLVTVFVNMHFRVKSRFVGM
jgi:hypothetical protein